MFNNTSHEDRSARDETVATGDTEFGPSSAFEEDSAFEGNKGSTTLDRRNLIRFVARLEANEGLEKSNSEFLRLLAITCPLNAGLSAEQFLEISQELLSRIPQFRENMSSQLACEEELLNLTTTERYRLLRQLPSSLQELFVDTEVKEIEDFIESLREAVKLFCFDSKSTSYEERLEKARMKPLNACEELAVSLDPFLKRLRSSSYTNVAGISRAVGNLKAARNRLLEPADRKHRRDVEELLRHCRAETAYAIQTIPYYIAYDRPVGQKLIDQIDRLLALLQAHSTERLA